jgi:hypothetical protein
MPRRVQSFLRLVRVQPQVESLGIDGGFGPKDIRLEMQTSLDMVKDDVRQRK